MTGTLFLAFKKTDYDFINLAVSIKGQADRLGIEHDGVPHEGVVASIAQRAVDAEARIAEAAKLHYKEDHECVECSFESMPDVGFRGISVPWPCPTVAALDGAPEPEWEYGLASRTARIPNVIGVSDNMPLRDEFGRVTVRRRKAGPWLPVEGEKP